MSTSTGSVMAQLKRIEEQARRSFERLPRDLPSAFSARVRRLRGALDLATRADVKEVSARLLQLDAKLSQTAKQIDRFVRTARKP